MSGERRGGARDDWWINVSCDTIDRLIHLCLSSDKRSQHSQDCQFVSYSIVQTGIHLPTLLFCARQLNLTSTRVLGTWEMINACNHIFLRTAHPILSHESVESASAGSQGWGEMREFLQGDELIV